MSNQRVLITGGAGFIGSAIAKKLHERGDELVLVDNFNDAYEPQLKRDRISQFLKDVEFTLYEADIRDSEKMNEIFETEKPTKVIHLAALAGVRKSLEEPLEYEDVNSKGTYIMLENAVKHKVKNFIYASSSSVYGNNTKMPFSENDPVDTPISHYAATKKANELTAHVYSHVYGLKTTGLRFFTVYGPWGRPDMALFLFADAMRKDEAIKVFNHGKMSRNFTYIDDIVNGTITVLDANLDYGVMNIGGDKEDTLMDYIQTLEKHMGMEAKKEMLPMQPGDVPSTVADISKLRALGWEPKTRIDEGIKNFVEWYRMYYGMGE